MNNLCKNCDTETTDLYCPHCSQPTKTKRIDWSIFSQEFIYNNFTLHKGLLFTIKSLVLKPKRVIEDYLVGKRIRYTGAVQFYLFILIFLGVFSLIWTEFGLFKQGKILVNYSNSKVDIGGWIKNLRILFIALSSFGTYLVYRSKKYNLVEHFIVNFYILGMSLFLTEVIMILSIYKLETSRAYIFFAIVTSFYIRIFYDAKIRIKDFIKGLWCLILSIFGYALLLHAILFISQSGWFN
jgi:hypothetical protein